MAIKYAKIGTKDLDGTNWSDWLWGDFQDNLIRGFGGNDNLYGGYGNDRLEGGKGADILRGAADMDTLIGGAGSDVLTGGTQADDFVFSAADAKGTDTIRDFSLLEDQIVLSGVTISGAFGIDTDYDGNLDATKLVLTDGTASSTVILLDLTGIDMTNVGQLTDANALL